ncbi:MAG: flagellar biosynthesis anti-sigma factor FlgM [Pseudomonadales bacterium]|nr:flagellar biosynthesis anti-sigma factor FlgM [Pseudomonadales bacterium]
MAIDFNHTPSNKNFASNRAQEKAQVQPRAEGSTKTPSPTQNESTRAASVSVSISSEAKSLERLESRVSKSSAFDKEKVASIKSAIEEGRYSINPEKLAEKIIEHELDFDRK